MINLSEKVIVITGGSSGLGRALAIRLAKEKANLVLVARNEDRLKEAVAAVESAGGTASYYSCDISKEGDVKNTFEKIYKEIGNIYILVNGAGIWFEGPLTTHEEKKIKELFAINVEGMIYCTKSVLETMKEKNSGQIFNVSSIAGVEASGAWGVYTATKFAVRGFTDSLKKEVEATKIKVMGFYPGGMNTNLFSTSGFEKESQPWMMNVDDIANIIAFMLMQPEDVLMDHVEVRKNL